MAPRVPTIVIHSAIAASVPINNTVPMEAMEGIIVYIKYRGYGCYKCYNCYYSV